MKRKPKSGPPVGRVLPPVALLGIGAGALLAFRLISPLVERRDQQAREAVPDLVSLSYLRLSLAEQPQRRELRLELAERLLAAGSFDEAIAVLGSLAAQGDRAAERLGIEIEYQHWLATDPRDATARASALGRLEAALERTSLEQLDPADIERQAQICAAAGRPVRRARLLGEFARRELDEPSVERADAAYLEVSAALAAAQLWASLALRSGEPHASRHAARALERARSADAPREALALFDRLATHFWSDPNLLELGLTIASSLDLPRALVLAERLQQLRPRDASVRERIAQLLAWTAATNRTVTPRAPPALGPEQELAQARAQWDLDRVLQLTSPLPEQRTALEERLAVLEALGRVSEALDTLAAALAGGFAADRELWGRQFALQLGAGRIEAALDTLAAMQRRFGPEHEYADRQAELLLALGRPEEALQLLLRRPFAEDTARARRVARLAWELGDLVRVREVLSTLVASSGADVGDFEQLWRVDFEARRPGSALATAQQGYQRFQSQRFLQLAIESALAASDRPAAIAMLERADGDALGREPRYPLLHAQLLEQQAERASRAGDLLRARRHSDKAGELIERAAQLDADGDYSSARAAQRRQALALALDADDLRQVAALYASTSPGLSVRERVQVLSRLGDLDAALDAVTDELADGRASGAERVELESDARALGAQLPRQLWLRGAAEQTPGLFSWSAGGGAEYAFTPKLRLAAAAELTRFDGGAALFSDPAGAEPWSSNDAAFEVTAQLRGSAGATQLSLGVAARATAAARPFGILEQRLFQHDRTRLSLRARLNDTSRETANLRLLGAEDQLSLALEAGLDEHWYASASAAGQAYWERDRTYLGAGVTINAGAGYNLPVGAHLGTLNLRVSTYVAPRFAADPALGFIPESTTWLGIGAGFTHGQLALPPVAGHELAVLTDATLGWLVPQAQLGWSGSVGFGLSVLGADLLSVSLRASNVFGTEPASAAYTLDAGYRLSEWK